MLATLEMEILLKAAYRLDSGSANRSHKHDYFKIWKDLGSEPREAILNVARERYAEHARLRNAEDVETVLKALKNAFLKGRYAYEFNEGRTLVDASEVGRQWLKDGGLPEEADLAYYPMECDGIALGCARLIEARLGIPASEGLRT
ncbi:hypothetical protein SAMN05421757_102367 [Tropicimonas sediminicola]|uniref:HEPN domain-containing protein n=2 Tax=Tropicimonas sediminicola TaxID=1031541 RepID=A0A239EYH1_9RHOB|nr:hypothetical protein SAMN05421757_102367 [Tropicimonas sediminicola]